MAEDEFERHSGWLSGSVVDAEDARLATGVLAAASADPGNPIAARTGIKPGPGSPGAVEATATPSREVTVRPFQGVVQGTRSTAAGAYLITLAKQKHLDVLTAAPAHSSNPRIALVVAQQTDRQYGDASDGMLVHVVAGAPAVTPVAPTVRDDCIPLAAITVRANAGSIARGDIKDLRVFTVAAGGVLPLQAHESLPADGYPGQRLHDLETRLDLVRTGTEWRPAVTGAVQFFGPADNGWPLTSGSAGATGYTFNQVTVPAAPYPRLLLITGQLTASTSGADERWDHVVRGQDGTPYSLACFHGGATRISTSVASGHRLLPANTPLVLTQFVARGGGVTTGTASVFSPDAHYTGLRVMAFPVP
ncbi:hypothetical protein [Streptomyces sp. GESEQ-4]|uniref:hypothetical protein n=1 Tax=Streptomyces sp. GESEQ-4 TaxID=2812655 RepID=UPI001B335F2F|nr:hypothetical protein [Streptomyces sp. GESEQ-4]